MMFVLIRVLIWSISDIHPQLSVAFVLLDNFCVFFLSVMYFWSWWRLRETMSETWDQWWR